MFFNNPQRIWEQVDIVQGVWNLRDAFKVGGQMLVLVTTPGSVLPVELQNDVMVIDEPLPSADDLRQIIPGMFESAELAPPDETVVDQPSMLSWDSRLFRQSKRWQCRYRRKV